MAITHRLIESKTLNSATSIVTFTTIPQTYTDLRLIVSSRATQNVGRELIYLNPNSNTSNNARIVLFGYDTQPAAIGTGNDRLLSWQSGNSTTANTFSNLSVYFLNYTSGNYKSYFAESVAENNSSSNWIMNLNDSIWSDTSPITSIQLACETSTFAINSTFDLYGIKNS